MHHVRRALPAIVAILALLVFARISFAQFRAGVQGTVVDANGARVPESTVQLQSQETNVIRTTQTTREGVDAITGLAPGHYSLVFDKPGFQKKILSDVLVRAEQTEGVDIQLDIAGTTESVTVDASA